MMRGISRRSDDSDDGGSDEDGHNQTGSEQEEEDVFGGGHSSTRQDTGPTAFESIFPARIVPLASTGRPIQGIAEALAQSMAPASTAGPAGRQRSRIQELLLVHDSSSDSDSQSVPRIVTASNNKNGTTAVTGRGAPLQAAPPTPPRQVADHTSGSSGRSSSVKSPSNQPLRASDLPVLRSPLNTPHDVFRARSPSPKSNAEDLPARKHGSNDNLLSLEQQLAIRPKPRTGSPFLPPPPASLPRRTASTDGHPPPTPQSRGPGSSRTTPVRDPSDHYQGDLRDPIVSASLPSHNEVRFQQHYDPGQSSPEILVGRVKSSTLSATTSVTTKPQVTPVDPRTTRLSAMVANSTAAKVDTAKPLSLNANNPKFPARKISPANSNRSTPRSSRTPSPVARRELPVGTKKPIPTTNTRGQAMPPSTSVVTSSATLRQSDIQNKQLPAQYNSTKEKDINAKRSGSPVIASSPATARAPRANSAETLAQSGAFGTAPKQTFGPCGCGEHDAASAFIDEHWIQHFLELSQQKRSAARFFNLECRTLGAPVDGTGGRRSKKETIGAWCSLDTVGRRRGDVLAPKRFLVICGCRAETKTVGEENSFIASSQELLFFPGEPIHPDTGLVQHVPCASFPLAPRWMSTAPHAPTDSILFYEESSVTFTRVRLSKRRYHVTLEVVAVPLGPLLFEVQERATAEGQHGDSAKGNTSSSAFRSAGSPLRSRSERKALSAALHCIQGKDEDYHCADDEPAEDSAVVAAATIGFFDAQQFMEVFPVLLDVCKQSRMWLSSTVEHIFSDIDASSLSSTRSHERREENVLMILDELQSLHLTLKSPLSPLDYRVPKSLWSTSLDRVCCALETDARLKENLCALRTLDDIEFQDIPQAAAHGGSVLTFDAFGTIKSAVNRTTRAMYDVRCLPHNKTRLYAPRNDDDADDGDAALMLEYVSRFPFVQRVHAVLSDSSRYYVVLPPLLSRQVLPDCQEQDRNVEYASLSDVCRRSSTSSDPNLHFEFVTKIFSQLILAVGLLHSRGVVAGALTPRRILCRVVNGQGAKSSIETTLSGIGVTSVAFSWLRQQRGVLEYLSPAFLAQFLDASTTGDENLQKRDPVLENIPRQSCSGDEPTETPSIGPSDDWWAIACIMFEVYSRGLYLFPIGEEGVHQHASQWADLLLPGGLHVDSAVSKDLMDYSTSNVADHVAMCVKRVTETMLRSGTPNSASQRCNSPLPSSNNLAARRVEERKTTSRNSSSVKLDQRNGNVHAWEKRASEFTDLLQIMLDIRNFSAVPSLSSKTPCPSGFHGFALSLMMHPFFKNVDWIDVYHQSKDAMQLSGTLFAAALPSTQLRSMRSASPSAPSPSSNRAASMREGSARKASASSARNAEKRKQSPQEVNPLNQYTAEEVALLLGVLEKHGDRRDRQVAAAVKRTDDRLHPWSADAIPVVPRHTSFLRPTKTFDMYRRAVRKPNRDSVDPQHEHSASPGKEFNMSAPARSQNNSATAQFISPLHHSYTFQRPKGFIDLVVDRSTRMAYDPPPLPSQGDVSAFTKSLVSHGSRRAVEDRRLGYMQPVADHGKGKYQPPEPMPRTFGEAPPIPKAHELSMRRYRSTLEESRRASAPTSPEKGSCVAMAGSENIVPQIPSQLLFSPVRVSPAVASPTSETALRQSSSHLETAVSVSPNTPIVDPSAALFTTPTGSATGSGGNIRIERHTPSSQTRPVGVASTTPANRPAIKLPARSTDTSSHETSRSSSGNYRETSPVRSRPSSRNAQPQEVVAEQSSSSHSDPVALPLSVASVRSSSASGKSDGEGQQGKLPPKSPVSGKGMLSANSTARLERRMPKVLGRWEKSDSDDDLSFEQEWRGVLKKNSRTGSKMGLGPFRSAQVQPAAPTLRHPPPPQHPLDEDDDDDRFS